MERIKRPPPEIDASERRTEVYLVAVDPGDPNDPVFLGFIDPVAPSVAADWASGGNRLADSDDDPDVAGDFLGSGTNRLADSGDPDWALSEVEPLAQYDPGPDHRFTVVAVLGMIGYLVTVGCLLCS